MAKRKKTNGKKYGLTNKIMSEILTDDEDDKKLLDDNTAEPVLEDVEDDSEFISKVKEFIETHKNSKLINVYKLIGKPSFLKNKKISGTQLKKEYDKLITILDKNKIIVHFQNEYPLIVKYRFVTEEIFKQDIENTKKNNVHINFIYEDFHPDMIDDDEVGI